jgi:glucosamine--fructose-6-phosphate aminotransferase (isomerizing)
MCGIVGYVGKKGAEPFLLDGLRRLEYRGYDSAGVCILNGDGLQVRKCVGRVARLEELLKQRPVKGSVGISHTRWATHGLPSDGNAHPHVDDSGKLALVHNGIIENYAALRQKLLRLGHKFLSQTDTEVLAHLVGHHLDQRLAKGKPLTPELVAEAVLGATRDAVGTYAIALVHSDMPEHIIGARRGSPLVVGLGQNEGYLASDVSPLISRTRKVVYLQDGDIAIVSGESFSVRANGRPAKRITSTVKASQEAVEKGKFAHYMLKEIFEQPERVAGVLRLTLRPKSGSVEFAESALSPRELSKVQRLILLACGTSWHSALVGEYLLENLAHLPVEVEYASEMRYRNRPIEKGTLVVSISQSGETADTLAAVRGAHEQGARTLAIVNVAGSTIARESDAAIEMRAGPEIGVASTKAFEMQLLWLTLLALALGRQRGHISLAEGRKMVAELQSIPAKLKKILAGEGEIKAVARKYAHVNEFLFMGRQYNFPVALEGALKLKEISYIHADGYPSAEMKHGPIALVSPAFPSVFVAPRDAMYDKNMSNIEEIRARKGPVIVVTTEGEDEMADKAAGVLYIPPTLDCLQPLLTVVPLQLLAYQIAVLRGCDVDKPRNLAKSVTVE